MDIFSENNDFDYEDIDDSFYNGKIHSSNNFFLKRKQWMITTLIIVIFIWVKMKI